MRIKTLHQICLDSLRKHLDCKFVPPFELSKTLAIKCFGDVPLDIIRPVLEFCTPQQLLNLEEYNYGLEQEDNEVWKVIFTRTFPDSQHIPGSSDLNWRDIYLAEVDKYELRLEIAKEKLRKSYNEATADKNSRRMKIVSHRKNSSIRKAASHRSSLITKTVNSMKRQRPKGESKKQTTVKQVDLMSMLNEAFDKAIEEKGYTPNAPRTETRTKILKAPKHPNSEKLKSKVDLNSLFDDAAKEKLAGHSKPLI